MEQFSEHAQWYQRLISIDINRDHLLLIARGCRLHRGLLLLNHRLIQNHVDVGLRANGLVEYVRGFIRC